MFEILDRDDVGRITKLVINKKQLILPEIAIVIDPRKNLIPPRELQETFKANLIITNAYLIKKTKNTNEEILKKGLHNFFDFSGIIMTDSGAYQEMYGTKIGITNKEVIQFQEKIKPDMATFLDVPTSDLPYKNANKTVLETIKRAKECKELTKDSKLFWAGPIQGGEHLDLVKKCARKTGKLNFDLYAVGSIVPKLLRYDFKTVCDIILTCKTNLPLNKPLHGFGIGLPNFMALAVAFGCDVFDSAAYALYAYDDRYMTLEGTHSLQELQEFPCDCPVCSKANPQEIKKLEKSEREKFLARHNLYVTFSELRTIRQAIRENCLWELVQMRCRAHPKLLEAFKFILKKYNRFFLSQGLVSKRSAFKWSGEESNYRPEVLRAKEWLKRVKSKKYFIKEPFGKIPIELMGVYPFSQSIIPDYKEKRHRKIEPKSIIRATLDYEFGKNASRDLKDFEVEISRKTGRIRRVYRNKELLGTIRASDGFFLPTVAAAQLLKKMKKVYIKDPEVVSFIKKGKSVFAKFVKTKDEISPGEEVAVCDKDKNIIAVGRALLNSEEMKQFKRGVAVQIRGYQK